MKTKLRLALKLAALAGLAALPSLADLHGTTSPNQPVQFLPGKSCLQFCMVAYCPQGACGPYVDAQGVQQCGCHDPYGTVGN